MQTHLLSIHEPPFSHTVPLQGTTNNSGEYTDDDDEDDDFDDDIEDRYMNDDDDDDDDDDDMNDARVNNPLKVNVVSVKIRSVIY